MKKPTQIQMYWMAHQKSADLNIQFMGMITGTNPITKTELRRLIKMRPSLWGRFSGYLETEVLKN